MDEKTIVRLSLICSLTGLTAIYAGALSARPQITPIASLDNEFIGLKVIISGEVIDLSEHRDGHLFLKLRDDSGGVIDVPIFSELRRELEESIELLDVMEVAGEVVVYRDKLEVVPDSVGDVKVIHTAPVKLSSLSEENVGIPVKVQGTIIEYSTSTSGSVIFTIQEDGSRLPVFIPYWVVDDSLPELRVGNVIRVNGWLQLYNNEIELRVVNASHLHLAEAM